MLAGAPDKRSEPSGSRFDVSGSRPRAAHGRMGPALSGRVAASDEQIREPEQQRDALRVLRQSPVAHLTVPEAPLHIQENGCSTFARTDALRFSAAASAPSRSSRRRLPGFIATCQATPQPLFSGRLSTPW